MLDDEIRDACVSFAVLSRIGEEDWAALSARMDDDAGTAWWRVLAGLAVEADSAEQIHRLEAVVCMLLERYSDALLEEMVGDAPRDPRLVSLVAGALLTIGHDDDDWRGAREVLDRFGEDFVTRTWVRYQRDESDWDAWSSHVVGDEIEDGEPATAWRLIRRAVATSDGNDEVLGMVGAALLEDFLPREPDAFIARVESEADRDPWFRRALGHVWIWNKVSDPIFDRLQTAAGVQLRHDGRGQASEL
jgi:hypothetical protein